MGLIKKTIGIYAAILGIGIPLGIYSGNYPTTKESKFNVIAVSPQCPTFEETKIKDLCENTYLTVFNIAKESSALEEIAEKIWLGETIHGYGDALVDSLVKEYSNQASKWAEIASKLPICDTFHLDQYSGITTCPTFVARYNELNEPDIPDVSKVCY